jgi:hypothetical protein
MIAHLPHIGVLPKPSLSTSSVLGGFAHTHSPLMENDPARLCEGSGKHSARKKDDCDSGVEHK